MPSVSERQRRFMGAELGRARAGQKTRTGMSQAQLEDFAMKPRSHMPKGATQSPRGNLGDLREREIAGAFPRRIKQGSAPNAARALPYRMPKTAIDAKYGPGDKVC